MAHVDARLTFDGRRLLVEWVRLQGRPVAHVARELGVSRRWVARYGTEGWAGLSDRPARPTGSPTAPRPMAKTRWWHAAVSSDADQPTSPRPPACPNGP